MAVLPEVAQRECMCCREEQPRSGVRVCAKGHAVCVVCRERMGRDDCLFCNPHAKRRQKRARPRGWLQASKDCGMACLALLLICARFVGCFMAATYFGKLFVYLYMVCNPEEEVEWFGWGRLDKCMGEALLGCVVAVILVGVCCGSAQR